MAKLLAITRELADCHGLSQPRSVQFLAAGEIDGCPVIEMRLIAADCNREPDREIAQWVMGYQELTGLLDVLDPELDGEGV